MVRFQATFKCIILSAQSLIYEKEISSLFVTGDQGEYELLAYHYPLIGILPRGNIIIDWKESVFINKGILRFFANECIILVEEPKKAKKEEEEQEA